MVEQTGKQTAKHMLEHGPEQNPSSPSPSPSSSSESPSIPTSSNAPAERSTVDGLIDFSAASPAEDADPRIPVSLSPPPRPDEEASVAVPSICGADPNCVCSDLECTGHPMLTPYCAVCFAARLPLCEHGVRGGGHWYPSNNPDVLGREHPEWCDHLPAEEVSR